MNDVKMVQKDQKIKDERPRVTYHGEASIGDGVTVECAVLQDGRRGYVLSGLQRAVSVNRKLPVRAFEAFLAKIAPNALKFIDNTSSRFEVRMPNGATGIWVEEGVLTDMASGIIETALAGKLRSNQMHMAPKAMAIMNALAKTGERGLIDEATGYQYHRAPNALQDLFSKLIREKAADWERRFHPEFYQAVCKLFGFQYGNKHRALPPIVGKITSDWIYEVIFPQEIIAEIKARQKSEKLHQWLEDGGLNLLEKQRDAVMMIARSSVDYKDFEARCSVAFYRPGQQVKMNFPQTEGNA